MLFVLTFEPAVQILYCGPFIFIILHSGRVISVYHCSKTLSCECSEFFLLHRKTRITNTLLTFSFSRKIGTFYSCSVLCILTARRQEYLSACRLVGMGGGTGVSGGREGDLGSTCICRGSGSLSAENRLKPALRSNGKVMSFCWRSA